jgi:hypothetical protein
MTILADSLPLPGTHRRRVEWPVSETAPCVCFWPAADRRHPAPTGCFAPRSGRADQKSAMRSRMTADG